MLRSVIFDSIFRFMKCGAVRHKGEKKMSIDIITIKYMGKKESLFRVIDAEGEVLQVLCSKEEAEEWMKSQQG